MDKQDFDDLERIYGMGSEYTDPNDVGKKLNEEYYPFQNAVNYIVSEYYDKEKLRRVKNLYGLRLYRVLKFIDENDLWDEFRKWQEKSI